MRQQTLHLPYSAPNLNDMIRATNDASTRRGIVRYQVKNERSRWRKRMPKVADHYTAMKAQWATRVLAHARQQHVEPFPHGAHVLFRITEVDRRRDPDNIASGAAKFVLDGLVKAGVLPNDGWSGVLSLGFEFAVNPHKGSVEVTLTEAT